MPLHFTTLWSEQIPGHAGGADGETQLVCIAGRYADAAAALAPLTSLTSLTPLAPPPDSYASLDESDLAIWTLRMAPGARWLLPAAMAAGTRRQLYFFKGNSVAIGGRRSSGPLGSSYVRKPASELVNGPTTSEFLMLHGKPIGEPVAQYHPFVLNTEQELKQAHVDHRRTGFGGWPWPDSAPVHGSEGERFARHADGRVETWPAHPRG